MIDPILGPVRYCRRCQEHWPDDAEFFYPGKTYCRACILEQNQAWWARNREYNKTRRRAA